MPSISPQVLSLPATPTVPADLPSVESIASLANAFFQALPGGPIPTLPSGSAPTARRAPSTVVPSSVAEVSPSVAEPSVPETPAGSSASPAEPSLPADVLDAVALAAIPQALAGTLTFARATTTSAIPEGVPPAVPSGRSAPLDELPAITPPYLATEATGAADSASTPFRWDVLALPPESVAYSPDRVPSLPREPMTLDPLGIRRDFPILEERVHGRRLVWLDNGATTQKPRQVIDRISSFYEHENSNVHRAAHTLAARATDAYEGAREKVRRFVNAGSTDEIVFVRGTTEGINLVAQSWGRQHITEGDEILLTHLEHHANIVPWQQLAAEKGAKLRVAPVDDSGQVILSEYERLLGPRTRLVAFTAVSNALGTITPAHAMVAAAHRHGATVLVDGAQAVSHMPVDVQSLDADFYVFSGHKVFAPTGIGVVYGKRAILEATQPWQGGGNMIADVTFERTVFRGPPVRFEAGTGNIADAVGLGAAIDYVSRIGMATIAAYEHELLTYATDCLRTVPGLRLYGTAPEKAGVLSFTLDGRDPEAVGKALDAEGIAVRAGHHCAQPILRRFGVEGTVRASLAPYNTRDDIDTLVSTLHAISAGRSGV